MFALQNQDYKEMYWSNTYGWTDEQNADLFTGTELDKDYCLELKYKTKGRWTSIKLDPVSLKSRAF